MLLNFVGHLGTAKILRKDHAVRADEAGVRDTDTVVRIEKLLGVTGNVVLQRLLGVILAALAVQYVIDGVRAALAA